MNVFDEIQAIIDSRDSCYCLECRKDKAAAIRQAVASDLRRRADKLNCMVKGSIVFTTYEHNILNKADLLKGIAAEYEKGE